MTQRLSAEPSGPVAQSVRIGFGALRIITLFLALAWVCSNIRTVPPDTQAVVLRYGQILRVQQSGLMLALPRPFETIDLLPGPERQLSLKIDAGSTWERAILDQSSNTASETVPSSAMLCLTGDGGV